MERSLPLQIGWKEKTSKIDSFFERYDTKAYKFDIDSAGNVFIIEMEGGVHASVAVILYKFFDAPNGSANILNPLITLKHNTGKRFVYVIICLVIIAPPITFGGAISP